MLEFAGGVPHEENLLGRFFDKFEFQSGIDAGSASRLTGYTDGVTCVRIERHESAWDFYSRKATKCVAWSKKRKYDFPQPTHRHVQWHR